MELIFVKEVRYEKGVRSRHDERHRVHRVVAEYLGLDGKVYRKSFEAKGVKPVIPQRGTHESIKERQWG